MWWWIVTWVLVVVTFLLGLMLGRTFRREQIYTASRFWLCCGYVAAAAGISPLIFEVLIRHQET